MSKTGSRASIARSSLRLKAEITCPHCWKGFRPGEVMWIASHPELEGDPLLDTAQKRFAMRFLPTRFTVDGLAIDSKGAICNQIACPHCHLNLPRALTEMPRLFLSILGVPSSGKSYFLASMTWQLRQMLGKRFRINFGDADPVMNQVLTKYEETLFLCARPNQLVHLKKTDVAGEWYDYVKYGQRTVTYPKPFVFFVRSENPDHSDAKRRQLSRGLCLYDNAGESFLPSESTSGDSLTQHLGLAHALLFLFDPSQHARFQSACQGKTEDPQLTSAKAENHPQHQVILEAANRIRNQTGLAHSEKYKRPVVVVVTKFDAWSCLLNHSRLSSSWVVRDTPQGAGLDVKRLKSLSKQIRHIVEKFAPEVVNAIDAFAENVTYIPVSALGCAPRVDEKSGRLCFRPDEIDPQFVEVPLLYVLHSTINGLIPAVDGRRSTGISSRRVPTSRTTKQSKTDHAAKTPTPPTKTPKTDTQPASSSRSKESPPALTKTRDDEAVETGAEKTTSKPSTTTCLVDEPQEIFLTDNAVDANDVHLTDSESADESADSRNDDRLKETGT